jgi:catechol 2,3-dioxygenase-like lactoylglutathione lyase family enzyme
MLDHIGITVSDLAPSEAFYEKALAPLGYRVVTDIPQYPATGFGVPQGYGKSTDPAGDFWIGQGAPVQTAHVAFNAESRAVVDAFFQAAVAAGGRDNGAPGLRPKYHATYYAAFVLDPDGHNIEAVCHR